MGLRYSPPPAFWSLGKSEVHLCFVPLAASHACLVRLESVLSPDERFRAEQLRTAELRADFITSRGLLRFILGGSLGLKPTDLSLAAGANGKPHVTAPASLRFNLSHAGGCVLYALGRDRELGVDLEPIQALPDAESIVCRFFSPAERADFLSLGGEARETAFYHGWTRKEAYVKATGEGLSLALDAFSVSLLPGEPPALRAPGDSRSWTLFDASPSAHFAAAVAAEGTPSAIHNWAFGDADHCAAYFGRDNLSRFDCRPLFSD